MIDAASRYYQNGRLIYVAPDGTPVPILKRRLLPQGDSLDVMVTVTVTGGQRPDLLAARLLGDPVQFWRIADANNAMNPSELTDVPGRQLNIPRPGQ
jgi:nucleoid-associated protein YgaU